MDCLDELHRGLEQGPSGGHANPNPSAEALNLNGDKWEFELFHPGLGSLGEPSLYLSYTRGLQAHEAAGVGKQSRDPGTGSPHHLQREWDSRVGGGFQQKVEFRYGSEWREEAACGGRRQRSGTLHTPCMMGSCLFQPIPHYLHDITHKAKFKPSILEQ